MYAIHRLCQSYQLAKFINLITATAVNVKKGKDLIVLAGDLNTSPGEPPFKLLSTLFNSCTHGINFFLPVSMTGLIDCCMHRYSHDVKMTLRGIEGIDVDEDLITCGHHSNTFTATSTHKTVVRNDSEELLRPSGKRIDFVLYKFVQECKSCVSLSEFNHSCIATKLNCDGKDPHSGLSFSDHQPVSVQLMIKHGQPMATDHKEAGDSSLSKLPLQALINYKNGTFFGDKKSGDHKNGFKKYPNDFHDLSVNEIGVEDVEHETTSNATKDEPERSTLLDILPGRRSSSITESKTVSKVHFTEDNLTSKLDDPSWSQLENCDKLLNEYLDTNYSSKQKKQLSVVLLIVFSLCLAFLVVHLMEMNATTLLNMWSLIFASGFSLLFAIESANRFERTAVKGILEEISCLLSFCPKYDR